MVFFLTFILILSLLLSLYSELSKMYTTEYNAFIQTAAKPKENTS